MLKLGYFDWLCKYLVFGLTPKEKAKTNKELALKIKELEKISDKINYFNSIKLEKIKYLKELDKITILLNNRDLMRKDYMAKNIKLPPEKRIATLGTYKKMLDVKKEKIVNKISELSASMNPVNYINKKRELENIIKINSESCNNKDEIIINLQKEFIKALKDNCFETEDINGLKNLLFKIRYYKYLYVTDNKQIKDIPNLLDDINIVSKQVIQKLVSLECIRKIANDNSLNQEIINNILDTKVIDLQALKFEINIKEDCIKIKTYEKEVFEKEFKIDGKFLKKNFNIKTGKIYKLFI